MRHRIQAAFTGTTAFLLLGIASMGPITPVSAADNHADNFCHNGFAPDGTCRKTEPDDIKASHIVTEYCDITPHRTVIGNVLDDQSGKQAEKIRADTFNDAEKKLSALRNAFMKLNHADVEKVLHDRMATLAPDDPYYLGCLLEIVARSFPQEFDDYQKLIGPGIDTTGMARYVKEKYLGKNLAMHMDPDKT